MIRVAMEPVFVLTQSRPSAPSAQTHTHTYILKGEEQQQRLLPLLVSGSQMHAGTQLPITGLQHLHKERDLLETTLEGPIFFLLLSRVT